MPDSDRSSVLPSPAEPRDLRAIIRHALPDCRLETVRLLEESARLRNVRRGDAIYPQGERVPLTLLLLGYGAFRRTTLDGQHLTIGVARSGDLFGYSSIAPVRSSVELVALTDSHIAQWPGQEIRALAAADPGLALDALDSIAASLHAMMERVEGFLHQDARRRVIRILSRHQDLFFGDPAILTRTDLPGLVGTSREMTGRVLRQLEREGIVKRFGRSGLRLLRPDRFEAGAA